MRRPSVWAMAFLLSIHGRASTAQAQGTAPGAVIAPTNNLVAEGIPPIPAALAENARSLHRAAAAALLDWHPTRRRNPVADALCRHQPGAPVGCPAPIAGNSRSSPTGLTRPRTIRDRRVVCFWQGPGGGEFFQFFRYDLGDGKSHRLTDGKSRNTACPLVALRHAVCLWLHAPHQGRRRLLRHRPLADPNTDRLLAKNEGGGWAAVVVARRQTRGGHRVHLDQRELSVVGRRGQREKRPC